MHCHFYIPGKKYLKNEKHLNTNVTTFTAMQTYIRSTALLQYTVLKTVIEYAVLDVF